MLVSGVARGDEDRGVDTATRQGEGGLANGQWPCRGLHSSCGAETSPPLMRRCHLSHLRLTTAPLHPHMALQCPLRRYTASASSLAATLFTPRLPTLFKSLRPPLHRPHSLMSFTTDASTSVPSSRNKRKDSTHDSDDLDVESLTSSTSPHLPSCKRRLVPSIQGSTYQEAAVKELRSLFGERADDAMIDSVYYEQCDEDMYKAIARLVAATGLHPHLVQEANTSQREGEERQQAEEEAAPQCSDTQPAFVSPHPTTALPPHRLSSLLTAVSPSPVSSRAVSALRGGEGRLVRLSRLSLPVSLHFH